MVPSAALLVGAIALMVLPLARGEDVGKAGAPHAGDVPHEIVISIPFELRMDESIEPEGHQAWRNDVQIAAMMELRTFVDTRGACGADDAETCTVVDVGRDAEGHPTAIVEKDLAEGCWYFRRARATVHLFQTKGEVWVTTKIVIRELPEPPKGR